MVKQKEKLSPLDEWVNFKNKIMMSDDAHSKELLRICETWMGYTGKEKADAYRQWDEYYELCSLSEPAALFYEMKSALGKKYIKVVQDLRARLAAEKNTFNPVMKPKCVDPYLIRYHQTCGTYVRLTYAAKADRDKNNTKQVE